VSITDRNSLLYYVIQIVYRRSVVDHLRETFTVAYGADAIKRLHRPFPASEWDRKIEAASKSAAIGAVRVPPRDDFDRLDVSQFAQVFEADAKLLLPSLPDEAEEAWRVRRIRIIDQMGLVTAARHPNSHPTSSDVGDDDLRYAIENTRRVVENFDPAAETQLTAVLRDMEGSNRSPDAFLPPIDEIGGQFVGRASELDSLWNWMRDQDSARWLLMGPGGRGKTAIAYEFARQVRESSPPGIDMIMWLTAKRAALIEGTIQGRRPNFEDLPSALRYILSISGFAEEADNLEPDAQRHMALELFRQLPTLLVIDDVDSLDENQDDAIEFFTNVAFTTRSKLLMTSRRHLLGLSLYSTLVEGLNLPDAEAFLDSRADRYGIPSEELTKKRRARIIEVTEASPLYLEDLLRLVGIGTSIDQSVANWKQRGGDEARRYALGKELDMLGGVAREVLVGAATPGTPVSLEELRRVTGRPSDDVQAAIAELRKLFLVPRARLVDGVERLSLDANSRNLVLDWARRDNPTMVERIGDCWRRIPGAGRRVGTSSTDSLALVRRSSAMASEGDSVGAERVLLAGLEKESLDTVLHGQLAILYASWSPPRSTEARQHFKRAEDLGADDPELYRAWVAFEMSQQEFKSASQVAGRGTGRYPADPELRLRGGEALWALGRRHLKAGGAAPEIGEAVQVLRPLIAERPDVPTTRRHREPAFRLTAYALAELIPLADREARAGRALSRNPADVVLGRDGQDGFADQERVRLRQVLNRWGREFPGEEHHRVAAKLRPLAR
jgi:hypothetical protein